ncbi:MAG: hypothetical protein J5I90_13065, partial [Caldilineales bacterium]|nr:hypothetical protein [Caldilineales bacterium]
ATGVIPTNTPVTPVLTPTPAPIVPTATAITIPPTAEPDLTPLPLTPTAILITTPTDTPAVGVSTPVTGSVGPVTTPITGAIEGPIVVIVPEDLPPETNPEALVSLIDTFVLYSAYFLLGCGVIIFGAIVAGVVYINRRSRDIIEDAGEFEDAGDSYQA